MAYLERDEMTEVEHAITRYFGLAYQRTYPGAVSGFG